MIWQHLIWYNMIWYDIIWYHIMSCRIIINRILHQSIQFSNATLLILKVIYGHSNTHTQVWKLKQVIRRKSAVWINIQTWRIFKWLTTKKIIKSNSTKTAKTVLDNNLSRDVLKILEIEVSSLQDKNSSDEVCIIVLLYCYIYSTEEFCVI